MDQEKNAPFLRKPEAVKADGRRGAEEMFVAGVID